MGTPGPASDPRGGAMVRWRDPLLGSIAVLLLGTAAGQMFFVVPRYRHVLEGLGVVPSAPARLALAASRLGLGIFAVLVVGSAVAYWKERSAKSGVFAAALSLVALLSAVYLALVSCVYWDLARVMGRIQ